MAEESTKAPQSPISFDPPAPVAASIGHDAGAGGAAPGAMSCAKCASPIGAYYYEAAGAVYCARCKREIEETTAASGGLGRGALFGLGAALLGAFGYWAFMKITGIEWALVSIAVGAFVAKAIVKGNGGRGSRRFQFLAVALTYLAIGGAYAPYVIEGLREGASKSAAGKATTDSASTVVAASSSAAASADATGEEADEATARAAHGPASTSAKKVNPAAAIGLFFGAVLLVALAGPILTVIAGGFPGSLINLAIIGFALMKAWQMTSGEAAATGGTGFTGPYKVSPRETSA